MTRAVIPAALLHTQARHKQKERTQLFSRYKQRWFASGKSLLGGVSKRCGQGGVTHLSPDGDAIFLSVVEVVGFKRVPEGEDDGCVVGPLEDHLHVSVMEANPKLVNV